MNVHNLYCDHHQWLIGWLQRRIRCRDDAADLAQDTFLRVFDRRREVDQLREPRAWLSTIAKGLMVDHIRRREIERAYMQAIAALPEPESPSPEATAIIVETLVRIEAMLEGLKPKARRAFLLSRLDGLTYPEIAVQLSVSLSSVEKYMATAIRHCLAMRGGQ